MTEVPEIRANLTGIGHARNRTLPIFRVVTKFNKHKGPINACSIMSENLCAYYGVCG